MLIQFRKHFIIILGSLLIFWFLISAFFYFHHRRPVWNAEVPGWQDYQRHGIQIKEVRILDWQERTYYINESELERRNRIITCLGQWLPETWQRSFGIFLSRAMYFYSLPYEKKEGLTIHLMGAAKKEFEHELLSFSRNNSPLIYINGEKAQLDGGTGMINKEDQESGILYFLITVECNPEIEINEIRDINVEFKRMDEEGSIFKQNIKIEKLDKEILAPLERYDDIRLKPSNIEQLKKR